MERGGRSSHDLQLELLRSGARSLSVALDEAQLGALAEHLRLLIKWNRVHNLTAVRDPAQMIVQHLLDCLAVVAPIEAMLPAGRAGLLDVGSGAGLPGAVLAIARPHWSVVCVDAVGKKAMFVRQLAAELHLRNLRSEHARVESLEMAPGFDIVVSRAFASLGDFTRLTRRHLAPSGVWAAMKGRPPDDAANLPGDVEVFHVEPLVVPGLQAQRCLVWMRPR